MGGKRSVQQGRLAFDYCVVVAMGASSPLINVQAFANQHDLEQRRRPITERNMAGSAGYYLVHYNIMSLVGKGEYHSGFDVAYDLASEGTYPEKRGENAIHAGGIIATCVSRPIPWSPHFLPGIGTICLGSIWKGADHTLLGHVIIHVARLLNWDEPMGTEYGGWNPDAITWWRKHLDSKPLKPRLEYPGLPVALTHGVTSDIRTDAFHIRDHSATDAEVDDFRIVRASNSMAPFKRFSDDIVIL